ncbi:MAG TPA: acyl carrier protein [Gemmatimonadales bacterium]|nr:acyl carrier protein [Gemmatimonadales bacterium]
MGDPTPDEIAAETLTILKRVGRPGIEPALSSELLADLEFDSIQVIELVAELEDHFNVSIPLNELPRIKTVADMVGALNRLLQEARSPG